MVKLAVIQPARLEQQGKAGPVHRRAAICLSSAADRRESLPLRDCSGGKEWEAGALFSGSLCLQRGANPPEVRLPLRAAFSGEASGAQVLLFGRERLSKYMLTVPLPSDSSKPHGAGRAAQERGAGNKLLGISCLSGCSALGVTLPHAPQALPTRGSGDEGEGALSPLLSFIPSLQTGAPPP